VVQGQKRPRTVAREGDFDYDVEMDENDDPMVLEGGEYEDVDDQPPIPAPLRAPEPPLSRSQKRARTMKDASDTKACLRFEPSRHLE
jgi:hypothetical protein